MTAPQPETNPILDLILAGDIERLATFHYQNMARTGGSIMVAPEGVAFCDLAFKRELLQPRAYNEPVDLAEALRWCVVVDEIRECDADTAGIIYLDPETGEVTIGVLCGPSHDHNVATKTIARDIQVAPVDDLAIGKRWADRIRKHRETVKVDAPTLMAAVNDNLPQKALLKVINPADWQGKPIPARNWFVPDLIPERNVTLFSGDGGMGKSLISLQIAVASALGALALGLKPQPGRVFYLGAEDEEGEFHRRMVDILASHRCSPAQLGENFRLSPMAGEDATLALPNNKTKQMEPTAMMAALMVEITTYKPNLLVLDTSADLFGGEEINRVQVRQFVGMLRKIAMSLDCAVLLLSHPSLSGIASGSGLSGSTAWNNSVRSRLYLTGVQDDDDARRLTTAKSNYGRKGGDIKLRWHDGVFVLDDGKASPVAGLLGKRHEALFLDLLARFDEQGQNVGSTPGTNYAPKRMADHHDAGGTTKKQFAAAMQRLFDGGKIKIEWDGPASRKRQRLVIADSTNPTTPLLPFTTSLAYHPPITPRGVEAPPQVETCDASPTTVDETESADVPEYVPAFLRKAA